jgi:hypothetical protein
MVLKKCPVYTEPKTLSLSLLRSTIGPFPEPFHSSPCTQQRNSLSFNILPFVP